MSSAAVRKRSWRGRFVKSLRPTPEGARVWLIWSHYHGAWHCRSAQGGACGYTDDIARAGLFERAKANDYNDGDRNEAFHFSEKLPLVEAAIRRHNEAIDGLLRIASADRSPEGGNPEEGCHAKHESAVPQGDAQVPSEDHPNEQ
jgi:hypothetical protein